MATVIRAALIDDHPVFRMGLRAALELDPEIAVVIDSGSPRETLALARDRLVDVAIIDVSLPEMSGRDLAIEFQRIQPRCAILALSMLDEPVRVAEMLRAGAAGFVHKSQPPSEILEAIRCVLGGVRYLSPALSSTDIGTLVSSDDWPLERLTTREREVFALMVEGCSNDDIATKLFIARRTVETHRHHVMHKLQARGLVDLVRIAMRYGLVS